MYKRSIKSWVKHLDFILIDILSIELALIMGCFIRYGNFDYTDRLYQNMVFIMLATSVITIFIFSVFKRVLKRGFYKEALIVLKQGCSVLAIASFYFFFTKTGELYSRKVLIYTCVLYMMITYLLRITYKQILLKIMHESRSFARRVYVVTTYDGAQTVVDKISKNMLEQFEIAGITVIDKDMAGEKIGDIEVVANVSDVAECVCKAWIDEVFINVPSDNPICDNLINQFVEMGVTTHLLLMSHEEFEANRNYIEKLAGYTVLTSSIRTISVLEATLKRIMDIMGGLVGCIFTGILILFVGPAIYIKSPGPIFFSQIRVGKNGKKFKIYKFRSMYLDAEERKKELMEKNKIAGGLMFKMDQDPRIIGNDNCDGKGIGNFIRNTSIDEFPQFLNVLKGDMSLVGTRPPTVDEWKKYELHHRARLAIKPGITGLWQVSGRSNITDFEEVVKLDRQYISEWSLGQDIKILLKTVLVVLKRDGSM